MRLKFIFTTLFIPFLASAQTTPVDTLSLDELVFVGFANQKKST